MRLAARTAAAVLAALCAAAAAGARPTAAVDARPMIVFRPAGLSTAQGVPLVLVLHGRGGDPALTEAMTRFDALAQREGFVVAYLKSAGAGWDSAGWSPTDDLDYVGGVIDSLSASENVDPARVFVAGFSSGADMAFRIGCDLAGKVTAIGAVSGGMATSDLPGCRPARPVSVLAVNGDADAAIPIGGVAKLAPAADTIDRWRAVDACPTAPQTAAASGAVTTQTWSPCAGGTAVSFSVIHGGVHVWPGLSTLDPSSPDAQLDATTALWTFFAAHPAAAAQPPVAPARPPVAHVDAHVRGSASHRLVLVSLRVGARGTLTAAVAVAGRRLAVLVVRVAPGARTLRLALPRRAAAGPYLLKLLLVDSAGRRFAVSRKLR